MSQNSPSVSVKVCSRCSKELLVENFHKQTHQSNGLHPWCKECVREYRLQNIDRERERQKNWYYKNHDKRLAHNRASYARNKETQKASRRLYSVENRELISHRWKVFAVNNKDYLKAKKAERKARILKNGGSFTKQEWRNLKTLYNNLCLKCGRSDREVEITPDHVIPLVKGGTSYISNIQPLCRSCNCSKRDKIVDYRKVAV